MNPIILLTLLSPIVSGYLLIQILFPRLWSGNHWLWTLWKLFLAPAVGFALVSLIYYLWSVIFSPVYAIGVLISVEILITLILLAFYLAITRSQTPQDKPVIPSATHNKWLLSAAALLLILVLANYFDDWLRESLSTPFGDWDAWAIWNLRASFISSGENWRSGFSEVLSWSHPDYPLLLPLNVARIWVMLAQRSAWVPILVSLIFQISLLGLLITSIQLLRGYLQGILAGLIGALVLFASLSFKLYADIPLAVYFLGANCLIFFAESESRDNKSLALLTGLLVGGALWTKNEGWAMLGAIVITKLLLDLLLYKSISQTRKWWGYFLLGLAPLLLATVHFKLAYAPPGDLAVNLNFGSLAGAFLSVERYLTIVRFAKNQILEYGSLILPLLPLMLIYAIIVGISIPKNQKFAVISLALRITLLMGIYFMVYLFTPKDLVWHLSTSMERLVTQIFPSFILLFFLVVSGPSRDEIISNTGIISEDG